MKHNHYFKQVPAGATHIDVYRVLMMFNVTDPCLQHAVKKLLVAGGRGAGKDITQDIKEAIDSLVRWQAMRQEDSVVGNGADRVFDILAGNDGQAFKEARKWLERADPELYARLQDQDCKGTQPQQWAQGPHGE